MSTLHGVTVVVGPPEHGVVGHALAVAAATESTVVRLHEPPAASIDSHLPYDTPVVHVHYTDRLFGVDAAAGGRRFRNFAQTCRRPLVVTLHDVPHPGGADRDRRRIDGYRLVGECASALVVSSDHERAMVEACGIGRDVTVIPLPLIGDDDAPVPQPHEIGAIADRRVVAVLGFVYPGKGHEAVVDALSELSHDVELWALGRASDGHETLVPELVQRAQRAGRVLRVTGFLADEVLAAAARAVDVAVVPALATSASATIGTWVGAGRRPITAANPYTAEIDAAAPGMLTLYDPTQLGALPAAIARALDQPVSTIRRSRIPIAFTMAGVAERHARLYRDVLEAQCAR